MALTKEEKKAKKEAKKQEKLRAEAEARKLLKRQELQREIAAQATKRGDLDRSWRQLMLKIKEPVFKQDIEVMWHVFERTYDKKDHLIHYTIKLMGVADEQVSRSIASFCETIDTMINKFLKDLEDMSKDNDRRTAALLKRGEDDSDKIMKDHNAAETHLQLLIYHGHTTADADAWTTRGENLVKQDEEKIKYGNERENLISYLENLYHTTWDDYKAVLRAYVTGTAENQKHVRKLRRKENLMADIIAAQTKRITNSDSILKNLRCELQQYESGTKQAVFRDRRNRHRAACFRLKQDLINGCHNDAVQLARLVRISDDAVEWLQAAHKKGEKILRLAALCRRFETQKEKTLPFGCQLPHPPVELISGGPRKISDNSLVTNAITSNSGLTRLWQRIAKAELSRRALMREKLILEEENKFFISRLNDENNIDTKGCLCVHKSTANHFKKPSFNKPVAVDGNFALKHYHVF